MNKDFEVMRAELWSSVYVAYVQSSNSTNPNGGSGWADKALQAFDERFKDRLSN